MAKAKPSTFISVSAVENGTYTGVFYRVVKNARTGKTYATAVNCSAGHRTKRDARIATLHAAIAAAGVPRPLTHTPFAGLSGLVTVANKFWRAA